MHLEALIPDIARLLGVEPATALLYLGVLVTVSNLIGRLIPDDATGVLGFIRKVAKIIGIYVPNTITSGVTVNNICNDALRHEIEEVIPEPVKAFPGLAKGDDSVDGIIAKTAARAKKGH